MALAKTQLGLRSSQKGRTSRRLAVHGRPEDRASRSRSELLWISQCCTSKGDGFVAEAPSNLKNSVTFQDENHFESVQSSVGIGLRARMCIVQGVRRGLLLSRTAREP